MCWGDRSVCDSCESRELIARLRREQQERYRARAARAQERDKVAAEKQARREALRAEHMADIIPDGSTLYDEDCLIMNPRSRPFSRIFRGGDVSRHDPPAFVAYPDGSRCWVHASFPLGDQLGGGAPLGLLYAQTDPWVLAMPWTRQVDFIEPDAVAGATPDEVSEVCVPAVHLAHALAQKLRRHRKGRVDFIQPREDALLRARLVLLLPRAVLF